MSTITNRRERYPKHDTVETITIAPDPYDVAADRALAIDRALAAKQEDAA